MREEISNRLAAVSIRDLLLVLAVQRSRGFRQAANDMGISASGLSHQVRKVEVALKATLFERNGQSVKTTPEGEQLLRKIAQIIDAVAELDALTKETEKPFGGRLRLGIISTLGPYITPHLLALFEKHYPQVRLDLIEGKTEGLTRRLQTAEIDLMLRCRNCEDKNLECYPLFIEPFDAIVGSGHPLALQDTVHISDVGAFEFLTLADFETYSEDTLPAAVDCQSASDCAGPCARIKGLSLETIGTIISSKGGASVVPSFASSRLSTIPNVKILRITGNAPQRTIKAAWRKSSSHSSALKKLSDRIASQFPSPSPASP